MRRLAWVIPILVVIAAAASDIRDAIAALQRGDSAAAEQIARAELRLRPNDPVVLSVLGAALDKQGKFAEAEQTHRRAVAIAPDSVDVLSNYATHQLASGDNAAARATYRKVIALDPANWGGNVQLARLALENRDGAETLGHLAHLPAAAQETEAVAALRLAARRLSGDRGATASAEGKVGLAFAAGMALAGAGHADAAEEFLEVARAAAPENVDVLYALAYADQLLGRRETAVQLLARAAKLQPGRADVQKLLAMTTSDLGALEDSAAAWDRYIQLKPGDDAARRERAYLDAQMGHTGRAAESLRAFIAKHPGDPDGHFELGMAVSKDDPEAAMGELEKALQLKPDFAAAHAASGSLLYQMGKPELALPHLEKAAALRPNDADTMDRLGQTYSALERPADAVRVLRRAAELAPDDSKTQLHYARALADDGKADESRAAMERFRRLGPAVKKVVPGGFVEYLNLPPEQRRADYRARVQKALLAQPEDPAVQTAWLRLLLEDGDLDAVRAFLARCKGSEPYREVAAYFAVQGHPDRALPLLNEAVAAHPQDREILLLRAVALALAGRSADSNREVSEIRERWPQWPAVRLAGGAGAEELHLLLQKPLREW